MEKQGFSNSLIKFSDEIDKNYVKQFLIQKVDKQEDLEETYIRESFIKRH